MLSKLKEDTFLLREELVKAPSSLLSSVSFKESASKLNKVKTFFSNSDCDPFFQKRLQKGDTKKNVIKYTPFHLAFDLC